MPVAAPVLGSTVVMVEGQTFVHGTVPDDELLDEALELEDDALLDDALALEDDDALALEDDALLDDALALEDDVLVPPRC